VWVISDILVVCGSLIHVYFSNFNAVLLCTLLQEWLRSQEKSFHLSLVLRYCNIQVCRSCPQPAGFTINELYDNVYYFGIRIDVTFMPLMNDWFAPVLGQQYRLIVATPSSVWQWLGGYRMPVNVLSRFIYHVLFLQRNRTLDRETWH